MDPLQALGSRTLRHSSSTSMQVSAEKGGHFYHDQLPWAKLSDHVQDSLQDLKAHSKEEKKREVAALVLCGIIDGFLTRDESPQHSDTVGYSRKVLGLNGSIDRVIARVKINEQSGKYDMPSIGMTYQKTGGEIPPPTLIPLPPAPALEHAALPPKASLTGLSTELLMQILGQTKEDGKGVNLNLRLVSWKIKDIADARGVMSPGQRFLFDNQPALQSKKLKHYIEDILVNIPDKLLDFITDNKKKLTAAGSSAINIIVQVGKESVEQRDFVAMHCRTLFEAGFNSIESMLMLGRKPQAVRDLIINNVTALVESGLSNTDMILWAEKDDEFRDFVVNNGKRLKEEGKEYSDISSLAHMTPAQRSFVDQYENILNKKGCDTWEVYMLARSSDSERREKLKQLGLSPDDFKVVANGSEI